MALKPSSSITAPLTAVLAKGKSFQNLFSISDISLEENTLPTKVDKLVNSLSFFTGNLFSSEKFYQIVQVTLLTSSCVGIIGAIGLLALGMPSFSLIMLSLSSTTAIGAYLAREVSSHNLFENNVEKIQGERERLGSEVGRLSKRLEDLENIRDDLKESIFDLREENKSLKQSTQKLQNLTEEISQIKEILPRLAIAAKQAETDREDFAAIKPFLEILPELISRFNRLETDVQQIKDRHQKSSS